MEVLMGFLAANFWSVAVVIVFLACCFIAFKNGYRQNVALACLILVTKAEEKFGSGTGEIKYSFVEEKLYEMLPKVVRFFFSANEIDDAIEKAVDDLQAWLENQSQ